MNPMRLFTVATIIAGIILVIFLISTPHTRDVAEKSTPPTTTILPLVAIHDTYKKGVHTITGSVKAPDACATVSAQASLLGDASSTQSILVTVTLPQDPGVCLQIPSAMPFSVTIAAPAHMPIIATVNGLTATTTAL